MPKSNHIFLILCKLVLPTRKDTIHNKWAVQEGSTIDFWIDKILTLKARFSKWYNSFRINLTNTICLLNKKEIKVNNKLHYFLLNEPKLKWWVYFNSNISSVSGGVQNCILKLYIFYICLDSCWNYLRICSLTSWWSLNWLK